MRVARSERESRFGKIREPVHATWNGAKFVAVGNQLVFGEAAQFRNFPDLLNAYARRLISPDPSWWKHDEHPAARAARALMEVAVGGAGTEVHVAHDGAAVEFLLLAYDLYVAQNEQHFQRRVLARLRHVDQYRGARIELAAGATFARAGFKLQPEDERDERRKHPEFIAVHEASGTRIAVEAKCRHRNEDDRSGRLGIEPLVRNAAEKAGAEPLVLYLELSAPNHGGVSLSTWLEELEAAVQSTVRSDGLTALSLIIATNRTLRRGVPPELLHFGVRPKNAALPISDELVHALELAVKQTFNIPQKFDGI